MQDGTDKIRNTGIIAHIDAGKTTTTERILYYTRKIHRAGNVDEGTTTTDWYVEEKRRGISIFSAAVTVLWKGFTINIIDTPGHIDFTAEVERSLRVLDGAVAVYCGVGGVEAQSETVWRQAAKYRVPIIGYINKLDRPESDFERVLEQIEKRLGARPVIVTMPYQAKTKLDGVIDLLSMKLVTFDETDDGETAIESEIPESHRQSADSFRQKLVEHAAEFDDTILEDYLSGKEVATERIIPAIRRAVIQRKLLPIYCGSSLKNKGVQPMMDGICHFLPCPDEVPAPEAKDAKSLQPVDIRRGKGSPPLAYSFKTFTDKYGEMAYLRIYAGQIRLGDSLLNPAVNRKERISKIFRMFSNTREELSSAGEGDIVATVGLKYTKTGETLCSYDNQVVLESIAFPDTVVSMSIEPKLSSDRERLLQVLASLSKDDPTFKVFVEPDTDQIVISGMGELQLDIKKTMIERDFNVAANVGALRVSYREAIESKTGGEGTHVGRIGDKQMYGHCKLNVEPSHTMAPTFEHTLTKEAAESAKQFVAAVRDAAIGEAGSGPLGGYPMCYLKVTLTEMKVTPDSSEAAYQIAVRNAFRNALEKTKVFILEPFVKVAITVPQESYGATLDELNRRGCQIRETNATESIWNLNGIAPLSKMLGFASALRTISQGRGSFTMEPFEYRRMSEDDMKRFFEGY